MWRRERASRSCSGYRFGVAEGECVADAETPPFEGAGCGLDDAHRTPYRKGQTVRFQAADGDDRIVDVEWAPTSSSLFLVNIQVEALDRARLLSDVTRALSDMHVNILSASVSTTRDRIALSRFTFEMADPKHLGAVLKAVRQVDGVFDAYRV